MLLFYENRLDLSKPQTKTAQDQSKIIQADEFPTDWTELSIAQKTKKRADHVGKLSVGC